MKILLVLLTAFVSISTAAGDSIDYQKQTTSYTVNYGETLARIALKYKVSVSYLLSINTKSIDHPDRINAGQKIKVPNKKAVDFITRESLKLRPLFDKLGAQKSKDRITAVKEMIRQDWRVIPLLLNALESKDPEIRENAREALRAIHSSKARPEKLTFDLREKKKDDT